MNHSENKKTRADYVEKLFYIEGGIPTMEDIEFFDFSFLNFDLNWLLDDMRAKDSELFLKGTPNDRLKKNTKIIERTRLFLLKQQSLIQDYSVKLTELEMQNEYLRKQLPYVSLKGAKVVFENGKLKMIDK